MTPTPAPETPIHGRILLADDDEIVRGALGAQLEHLGFACVAADCGAAALELLRRETFDALVADIHMPGNAGLELVEAIPQVAKGLPIVLLTGRPSIETAARSVRLAVHAYLVKPPDKQELRDVLIEAISVYRQRRAVSESRDRLETLHAELRRLETRFAKGATVGDDPPMNSFLRLTLRNIAASILDLERAALLLGQKEESSAALDKEELLTALRYTVEVLEKTRQNFKSKDLGQLRSQIEWLLRRQNPQAAKP